MDITIKNCNNIDECNLVVERGQLNIKYGINGTGKTTIAKALIEHIKQDGDLMKLTSFKNVGIEEEDSRPSVVISEVIDSIKVFNNDYVDKYLFQKNLVISKEDSYKILLKDSQLDSLKDSLADTYNTINTKLNVESIKKYLNDVNAIKGYVDLNTDNSKIKGTSKGLKAYKSGNKIIEDGISDLLKPFERNLLDKSNNNNANFVDWFSKGNNYEKGLCAYCNKELDINFETQKTELANLYKKPEIKGANEFETILNVNTDFLSEQLKNTLKDKFLTIDDTHADDVELVEILKNSYCLNEYLNNISGINPYTLLNEDNPQAVFDNITIGFDTSLSFIKDGQLKTDLILLITEINLFSEGAIEIQRRRGQLDTLLRRRVTESKKQINDFLIVADIPYRVDLIDYDKNEEPSAILKSVHQNTLYEVNTDIKDHLSFGEKNAFSLIMFMLDVISDDSNLVILDDPVSSFDENKKYAIMHELFKRNSSNLRDRTVIMFTHDLNPLIDFIKINKPGYQNVNAKYLVNDCGNIDEQIITKDDIKNVIQVAKSSFKDTTKSIVSRIVQYRRYLELNGDASSNKYNAISSLLKNKEIPCFKVERDFIQFSSEEIDSMNTDVSIDIEGFNYSLVHEQINTTTKVIAIYNNPDITEFEKIHLVRLLIKIETRPIEYSDRDKVIMKFIDEAYHIENTLNFQFDPYQYNYVPKYLIDLCDTYVSSLS